jgi:3-oxoadipate enol-lactonase
MEHAPSQSAITFQRAAVGNQPSTHHVLEDSEKAVHYWLTGPRDRPVVVLTHAMYLDHHVFDPQISILTSHYRVLTWDVPGHGDTPSLGSAFSIRRAACTLLRILDQVRCEQCTLVGLSMGGAISQEAAYLCPKRVSALVVIGFRQITNTLTLKELFILRAFIAYLHVRMTFAPKAVRRHMAFLAASTHEARQYIYDALSRISERDFFQIASALTHCFHRDAKYALNCPLLVMAGEHDWLSNFKESLPTWAATVSNGRYAIVPQGGHVATLDNPDFCNRALVEFLSYAVDQKGGIRYSDQAESEKPPG